MSTKPRAKREPKAVIWKALEFPIGDTQFNDWKIKTVEGASSAGWSITTEDGWSFWVQAGSPVKPAAGMSARFYGKGIGYTVRGLFLDGRRVFYRTEEEQSAHQAVQLYGRDATDWLARWDANDIVWSIAMGGFGPSYEQAIQITAAEILRHMLKVGYDHRQWADTWTKDRKKIETEVFKDQRLEKLGLSGMQFGAALSLASTLYRFGPQAMMADERNKDRQIQVHRVFPQL